jgi:hypothetical protein
VPKDIEISIVGTQFQERTICSGPLIENLLDKVIGAVQLESHRLCGSTYCKTAFNGNLHSHSSEYQFWLPASTVEVLMALVWY